MNGCCWHLFWGLKAKRETRFLLVFHLFASPIFQSVEVSSCSAISPDNSFVLPTQCSSLLFHPCIVVRVEIPAAKSELLAKCMKWYLNWINPKLTFVASYKVLNGSLLVWYTCNGISTLPWIERQQIWIKSPFAVASPNAKYIYTQLHVKHPNQFGKYCSLSRFWVLNNS